MLHYFVLLKWEVVKEKTPRDTDVLINCWKIRCRMLRCFVLLKCEEKKRCRMLRYFVVLTREERKKRLRMLRYFVILKCEVVQKPLHAALLCDTEV